MCAVGHVATAVASLEPMHERAERNISRLAVFARVQRGVDEAYEGEVGRRNVRDGRSTAPGVHTQDPGPVEAHRA
jgi:hypothetical protein